MKKYYKVVGEDNLSARADAQFKVKYELNKWTKPKLKGSRLFVFSTLESAQRFANRGERIYECEVEQALPARSVTRPKDYPGDHCKAIVFRWAYFNRLRKQHKAMAIPGLVPPAGTIFAKRVKLTRFIEVQKYRCW